MHVAERRYPPRLQAKSKDPIRKDQKIGGECGVQVLSKVAWQGIWLWNEGEVVRNGRLFIAWMSAWFQQWWQLLNTCTTRLVRLSKGTPRYHACCAKFHAWLEMQRAKRKSLALSCLLESKKESTTFHTTRTVGLGRGLEGICAHGEKPCRGMLTLLDFNAVFMSGVNQSW